MYDLKNKNLLFDVNRLIREMEEKKIDIILATSRENVGYLSGYFVNIWNWKESSLPILNLNHDNTDYAPMVAIPRDLDKKTPFLVEHYLRRRNVDAWELWIKDVKTYFRSAYFPSENNLKNISYFDSPDIKNNKVPRTPIEAAVEGIKERLKENCKIGIEEKTIPNTFLKELKNLLPSSEFVDISDILIKMRSNKTKEEIKRIGRAYEITEKACRAGFKIIKPMATPYEIFNHQLRTVLDENASVGFYECNFGRDDLEDYSGGPKLNKKIQDGDYGVIDMGVFYEGYISDLGRTISLGKPSEELRKAYDVLLGTKMEMLKKIEIGLRGKDLFSIGVRYMESKGFAPAVNSLGHGIGIEVHERPFINSIEEAKVEEGNVLTIEIYCEAKHLGNVGELMLEDVILVTEDGFKNLYTLDDGLIVL